MAKKPYVNRLTIVIEVAKMKLYDIRALTEDDVRQMISAGDDSHMNQIRVSKSGEVYLSQDIVGAIDIDDLRFRFETFDAGNGYVGNKAANDRKYIDRLYRTIIANWNNPACGTYIDIWEQ